MTNKLNYAQRYMSELIGIFCVLQENKAQYIVLIHNRMHSLKIKNEALTYVESIINSRSKTKAFHTLNSLGMRYLLHRTLKNGRHYPQQTAC
jgi:hypothetical protein